MEQPRPITRPVPAWNAVLRGRCPVCREGAVFQNSMLSLKFLDHHPNCPVCGTQYEVEPGFFWGAMYFNYSFNIAMLAITGLLLYLVFRLEDPLAYIFLMLTPLILSVPLTARLSRMLWIYIFGPFKYRGPAQSQ